MQWLRQSTQVYVIIGPFVDVGDGFVPETGITLSGADEAELLKANTATVTDISAATWAAVSGADGYYALTLTTSHTDTCGPLTIIVNDDSVCLPVLARFMVVEEQVWDSLFSTDKLQVHVDEMTAGIITATVVADGTIDAGAIASDAITDAKIATGAITAAKFAAGAIDAPVLAANAISATAIASNAITAAKIASDAITSAKLADGAITAAKIATDAIDADALAADAIAEINATVDTALADIHLDHLLAATYDPASKPGASDALLNEMVEDDGGVSRYTANALEQAPTGGSAPTAAQIADAVWDEASTGHTDAGKAGAQLWTDIDALVTQIAAIYAKIPTNYLMGSSDVDNHDTDIDAILVDTAALADTNLTEPSSGAPSASLTLRQALAVLYFAFRNKRTVTSALETFFNDAGSSIFKRTLSDDGTTFTAEETAAP